MKGKREIAPIWHALADEVLAHVAKGMNDRQVAAIYGVSATTIYNIRKHYNVPSVAQKRREKEKPEKLPQIERDGQLITICPPRYAANAYMTNWVRPTGRR